MTLEGTSAARSYISRIRSSRCLQGRGQRGPRGSILGSQAQHGSGHSILLRVTHGSSWLDRRTLWGPRSQPTVAKGLAVRHTFLSAPVMAVARQPGGVGDQPRSGRGVGARSPGSSGGKGQVVRRHRKRRFRGYPPENRQVVGETQTSPSGAQAHQEGRGGGGDIRPPRADGSPGGRGRGRHVSVNARGSVRVPGAGTS